MRPMTPENARKAYAITEKMPNVHGAPVHMGDGAEIGIGDIMNRITATQWIFMRERSPYSGPAA